MRLTFSVFALIVLQLVLRPLPAGAATPSDCPAYSDTVAKDLETNTTRVDDLARPNSPSPDHIAQSAAGYNKFEYYSKICPTPKNVYVDALLATWSAWLEHATTHVNPVQTAETAAQKLKQCAVTYSGTDDGTTCAAWQKQLIEWQNEWSSP
jgi:hypothetical protein